MTDHEAGPIIIMLRDLRGDLLEEVRQTREHLGNAIGEARGEIRSLTQALDHHSAMDDLRFGGVAEAIRRADSDHRELKRRVDAVDETGRHLAQEQAETRGKGVHLDKADDRQHSWVKYVVGVTVSLAIAALTFFATLALNGCL